MYTASNNSELQQLEFRQLFFYRPRTRTSLILETEIPPFSVRYTRSIDLLDTRYLRSFRFLFSLISLLVHFSHSFSFFFYSALRVFSIYRFTVHASYLPPLSVQSLPSNDRSFSFPFLFTV